MSISIKIIYNSATLKLSITILNTNSLFHEYFSSLGRLKFSSLVTINVT